MWNTQIQKNFTLPQLDFLSISSLNLCRVGSWIFCQYHHWTYVDLEVESLIFCQCICIERMQIWKLEVGRLNVEHTNSEKLYFAPFGFFLSISSLNICRFGSWIFLSDPYGFFFEFHHWIYVDLEAGCWKIECERPRFSKTLHCPIWIFCQFHHWTYADLEVEFFVSVIIEHMQTWKFDFLSLCHHWIYVDIEVGSWIICLCHHWTYVDVEVGRLNVEHKFRKTLLCPIGIFVSFIIEHSLIWKLDFLSATFRFLVSFIIDHMQIWKLEVGFFLSVSPLNISRFGSWKLDFSSISSLNICKVGSWIFCQPHLDFLSVSPLNICKFGSCKLDFLSVSSLNVCRFGSRKLDFLSVPTLNICRLGIWIFCHPHLEFLSVSSLIIWRFGSLIFLSSGTIEHM